MSRFESRPGGVYRTISGEAIPVTAEEAPALEDYQSRNLADSLRTIADEASHLTLWALVSITFVAIAAALFLLPKAQGWQHFGALATAVAFLTVSGCTGVYLISIKTGGRGQ